MLKDIRVLDLADGKGSFCSKLLADLGASVVKIEKPLKDRSEDTGQDKCSRAYLDTNKHSVTLDPELAENKKTFLGLVSQADVLVETFQPGYLEASVLGTKYSKKKIPALFTSVSLDSVSTAPEERIVPVISWHQRAVARCTSWVIPRSAHAHLLASNLIIRLPFLALSASSSP